MAPSEVDNVIESSAAVAVLQEILRTMQANHHEVMSLTERSLALAERNHREFMAILKCNHRELIDHLYADRALAAKATRGWEGRCARGASGPLRLPATPVRLDASCTPAGASRERAVGLLPTAEASIDALPVADTRSASAALRAQRAAMERLARPKAGAMRVTSSRGTGTAPPTRTPAIGARASVRPTPSGRGR